MLLGEVISGAPIAGIGTDPASLTPVGPATPALSSPAAGAANVATNPTLSWAASEFAVAYDLYVDTVNPPATLVASSLRGTSRQVSLQPSTRYYWQVVAKNTAGSTASAVQTFTTARWTFLVQTAQGAAGNTTVTTDAIDTTGADLIVVAVSYDTAGTFSDSKGNTWSSIATSGGRTSQIFYCWAPTVGAGHTFSYSTGFPSIAVMAFSGAKTTTNPKDQQALGGADFSASTFQAGSITPTQDNELVCSSCLCNSADGTVSVDSGFAAVGVDFLAGNHYGCFLAYKIQGTAAAVNPQWSRSIGGGITGNNISFFAAPAGSAALTAVFRRSLSALGARIGSRQLQR